MYINKENQPLVSIGIPTYNRPAGLRRTLECITQQTYPNLEIIISDNCSPNSEVSEVIQSFAEVDHRINYFKQPENIGAGNNFKFVLEKSSGEYFMWAADDDEWEKVYIERMLSLLKKNHEATIAFSNLIVVNPDGSPHESYLTRDCSKNFKPFTSNDKISRIISYVTQDGCLGKAHLIYGLLNRNLVYRHIHLLKNLRGSDCLFVASLLCCGKLEFDNDILYKVTVLPEKQINALNTYKETGFSSISVEEFTILSWIQKNINPLYRLITYTIFEDIAYKIAYIDIALSSRCYNLPQILRIGLIFVLVSIYEVYKELISFLRFKIRMYLSKFKRSILRKYFSSLG